MYKRPAICFRVNPGQFAKLRFDERKYSVPHLKERKKERKSVYGRITESGHEDRAINKLAPEEDGTKEQEQMSLITKKGVFTEVKASFTTTVSLPVMLRKPNWPGQSGKL